MIPIFCIMLSSTTPKVKKATGLGVTEFFLRLMAWLCIRNGDYRNSQMCIVTGPNIDIAINL
jgi:hypothetical protein